ncbi:hypothetical protein ATCC90586_009185 [Pythium insidiosum]|nr:hypothetical protein ATCC90586_009185 [Pythium insidiosum]
MVNSRKGSPANVKGLLWALLDRYHQATSTKMYDVEELIDFYFHRRLAAVGASECDGETIDSVKKEFEEAKAKDPYSLDAILLGIYVIYLTAQAMVTSDAATEAEATRHHLLAKCNDQYRVAYVQKYRHVVRVASFMGISAHVFGLYIAYYMAIFYWDALFYVQLYFAVVLNAVLAVSLLLYWKSGMAAQQPLNHAI